MAARCRPAWRDIALNGRGVYVADDSVVTNPKVHVALADIGGHLTYKKARRPVRLPARW